MTSVSLVRKILSPLFDYIDRKIKFSNVLTKGDVAIQLGFDMDSTTTSDLFHMANLVGENGTIIGVEADLKNIKQAERLIAKYKSKIILINRATYSHKTQLQLDLARKTGWNRLEVIPGERNKDYFIHEKITVDADTLDNIIKELKLNPEQISHISLTINGAEYETLKGMTNILNQSKDISLYIVAGRAGEIGMINGIPDYQVIMNFLKDYGFKTKFIRNHPYFWYRKVKNPFKSDSKKKDLPGIVVAKKGIKSKI